MDKQPIPVHNWRVRLSTDPTQVQPVKAAYLNYDDPDFVEFKDGNHKTIYVVKKDALLDAGRLDPNDPNNPNTSM
jgi:hypothetical protein